jgi:hypothetical protein
MENRQYETRSYVAIFACRKSYVKGEVMIFVGLDELAYLCTTNVTQNETTREP